MSINKETDINLEVYPLHSSTKVGVFLGWAGIIASLVGIPILSPDTASLTSKILVTGACTLISTYVVYFTKNKFFHIEMNNEELIFRNYSGREVIFLRKDIQKVISVPGARAIIILKFINGGWFWFSCAGNNINHGNKKVYQEFMTKLSLGMIADEDD